MQRLNTLKDASTMPKFNPNTHLSMNIIVADRYDLLLYRMITLNNGQKPMTARHQIEMLTKGMIDTGDIRLSITSEKDSELNKAPQGSFKRSDVAEAYTAFLTDSVHNQNSRIIESKLDEILVGKVMDSDLSSVNVSFHDILKLVEKFSIEPKVRDWLRLGNNLVGFTVGAKRSHNFLKRMRPFDFLNLVTEFDQAFGEINVSKINVGKTRRELCKLFFEKIERFSSFDVESITEAFHEATLVD